MAKHKHVATETETPPAPEAPAVEKGEAGEAVAEGANACGSCRSSNIVASIDVYGLHHAYCADCFRWESMGYPTAAAALDAWNAANPRRRA